MRLLALACLIKCSLLDARKESIIDVQLTGCNTDCGAVEVRLGSDPESWYGLVMEPWTEREAAWVCSKVGFDHVASLTKEWTTMAKPKSFVIQTNGQFDLAEKLIDGVLKDAYPVGLSCGTGRSDSSQWAEALAASWNLSSKDVVEEYILHREDNARPPSPFADLDARDEAFIFSDKLADEWTARHAALQNYSISLQEANALSSLLTPVGLRTLETMNHSLRKLAYALYLEPNPHAAWLAGNDDRHLFSSASSHDAITQVHIIDKDEPVPEDQNNHIYHELKQHGFAYISNFGLTSAQLNTLSTQAHAALSSKNRSIVSTTSNGRVATARIQFPILEDTLLTNRTIVRAIQSYLGYNSTLDGYKATFLKGLSDQADYIASLWHHDRVGKRLKLFLFLHDVDCDQGHPTQVAAGTHTLRYYKTDSFIASRFHHDFVSRSFPIIKGCGPAGAGFLFDTHSIHKGTPEGDHDRLTIIAEFHQAAKCPTANALNLGLPCPSGDQYASSLLLPDQKEALPSTLVYS